MFPVPGNFGGLCYTTWQLCCGNNSNHAWIYEIHHVQLKFVSIYRKEGKIIELTYFLATLPNLATKIAITRYLVIVSIWD